MNISHGIYADTKIAWHTLELPLKAGTPMSIAGVVANGADAFGIVPQTITHIPLTGMAQLLIGGEVSLVEVEKAYGAQLTEDAIKAMSGIIFYAADGRPVKTASGGGGGGGIFKVTISDGTEPDTYVLDKTYNEIVGAWEAGMLPVAAEAFGEGYEINFLTRYAPASDGTPFMVVFGQNYTSSTADGVLTYEDGPVL